MPGQQISRRAMFAPRRYLRLSLAPRRHPSHISCSIVPNTLAPEFQPSTGSLRWLSTMTCSDSRRAVGELRVDTWLLRWSHKVEEVNRALIRKLIAGRNLAEHAPILIVVGYRRRRSHFAQRFGLTAIRQAGHRSPLAICDTLVGSSTVAEANAAGHWRSTNRHDPPPSIS